jgi:hypothetical protein
VLALAGRSVSIALLLLGVTEDAGFVVASKMKDVNTLECNTKVICVPFTASSPINRGPGDTGALTVSVLSPECWRALNMFNDKNERQIVQTVRRPSVLQDVHSVL